MLESIAIDHETAEVSTMCVSARLIKVMRAYNPKTAVDTERSGISTDYAAFVGANKFAPTTPLKMSMPCQTLCGFQIRGEVYEIV